MDGLALANAAAYWLRRRPRVLAITYSHVPNSIRQQLRSTRVALATSLLIPLALLVAVGIQDKVPVHELMRDTNALAREAGTGTAIHAYTGAVSNLGILLWCAAASITVFTSAILRALNRSPRLVVFLFCAFLLTLVLTLDDCFQIHEVVSYTIGVPDTLILVVYALLGIVFMLSFWPEIMNTDYVLLLVSIGMFAISFAVDTVDPKDAVNAVIGPRYHLFEDGPKLIGISTWLGYFIRTCWLELVSAMVEPRSGIPSITHRGSQTNSSSDAL
jgi:hypothetical protein